MGQAGVVLVRREVANDVGVIDQVHRQAFAAGAPQGSEPIEVGLVHALRADPGWVPALSLVAEVGAQVVGHVVCSKGAIDGTAVVGLGPIAVLPDHQGRGVGDALMHAVLGAADALEYPVVGLLGSVDYYPRYGFVPASELGIAAPDPAWGAHFQARTLATYRTTIVGSFRYAAPFDAL